MRTILLFMLPALCAALPPVEQLTVTEANAANHRWLESSNHSSVSCAYTGSMRPYIMGGETVLLERRGARTGIYRGDLVVYENGRPHLAGHEVIDVRGGFVLTKGMANEHADNWIPLSRVKWVVRRVIRVTSR